MFTTPHRLIAYSRTVLPVCVLLLLYAAAQANTAATIAVSDSAITSKDVIMILFGLLQTVFMGIGVWLINNQAKLFEGLNAVRQDIAVQIRTCDERTGNCVPEHSKHPSSRGHL
jgi:hypothetical protein